MELRVNRKKFIEELKTGSMCAAKGNASVPVLLYTRIRISSNGIFELLSSDSSQTVNYEGKLGNEIKEYDSTYSDFMIDGKEFINVLSSIKDENVSLELSSKVNCNIKHDKGCITLPVYPVDNHTPIIDIKGSNSTESTIVLETGILKTKLKKASFFAGNDAYRPVLSGVYLNIQAGVIEVAATNSFIMYVDSIKFDGNINMSAIIPCAMVNNITSLLHLGDKVKITLFNGKIVFEVGNNIKYSCSVIDGKYPNYKAVIPQNIRLCVTVEREDLIEAVRRQIYTTDASNKCIFHTRVVTSELEIESSNVETGKENHETLSAKMSDTIDFTIGAKTEYLLTAIERVEGSNVVMQFTEVNKPILIQEGEMKMVVMPLNLK